MGDDGSLWQGAGAWVILLWALREYREWSLRLASPAMQQIARPGRCTGSPATALAFPACVCAAMTRCGEDHGDGL